MFGFIMDSIENAIDVVVGGMEGDDVSRSKIAKLLADGLTVIAVASAVGVAVDVVENIAQEITSDQ